MDFGQIKELIKLIDSSELAFFEINTQNEHIKMDKSLNRNVGSSSTIDTNTNTNKTVEVQPIKSIIQNIADKKEKIEVNTDETTQEDEEVQGITITSPMVGTFYTKASPESDSFVKQGDTITKGKVLCIIEAMKLMNEIESEYNGTILKCLVNDGDMVEYGQPLFIVEGE